MSESAPVVEETPPVPASEPAEKPALTPAEKRAAGIPVRGRPPLSDEEKARRAAEREKVADKRVDVARKLPTADDITIIRAALKPTFGIIGAGGYRLLTREMEHPPIFPESDADRLAEIWAPIVARYLDSHGDLVLWVTAAGGSLFIAEKNLALIGAAKRAEKKSLPKEAAK